LRQFEIWARFESGKPAGERRSNDWISNLTHSPEIDPDAVGVQEVTNPADKVPVLGFFPGQLLQ
jgi:hypothetical protein